MNYKNEVTKIILALSKKHKTFLLSKKKPIKTSVEQNILNIVIPVNVIFGNNILELSYFVQKEVNKKVESDYEKRIHIDVIDVIENYES